MIFADFYGRSLFFSANLGGGGLHYDCKFKGRVSFPQRIFMGCQGFAAFVPKFEGPQPSGCF